MVKDKNHSIRRWLYSAVHSINVLVQKQKGPLTEFAVCFNFFVVDAVWLDEFFKISLGVDYWLFNDWGFKLLCLHHFFQLGMMSFTLRIGF